MCYEDSKPKHLTIPKGGAMYESSLIDEVVVMFLKHIRPDGDISYFTQKEVERLEKIKELLESERR